MDCLKRGGGLGQFADLKGGLARKRGVVFLRGGVDTPVPTMKNHFMRNFIRENIIYESFMRETLFMRVTSNSS